MSLIVQLICEDRDLTVMMVSVLNSENFKVVVCDKPLPGLLVVQETLPDTVILEDRLSMVDSVDLCYHIGNLWRIPLILIGDEGTETGVSGALMRGADFFMLRPLSMRERVARVKALPRREKNPVRWTRSFLNPEERSVTINRCPIMLTATEYRLLTYMMLNEGRVIPSDELLEAIWPGEHSSTDTLKFHISQLRQKIGDRTTRRCIANHRGMGYRFARQPDSSAALCALL